MRRTTGDRLHEFYSNPNDPVKLVEASVLRICEATEKIAAANLANYEAQRAQAREALRAELMLFGARLIETVREDFKKNPEDWRSLTNPFCPEPKS